MRNVIKKTTILLLFTINNCFALGPRSQIENGETSNIPSCVKNKYDISLTFKTIQEHDDYCGEDVELPIIERFKMQKLPRGYQNFSDFIQSWEEKRLDDSSLKTIRESQRESHEEKIFGELLRLKSLNNVLHSYALANKKPFDLSSRIDPKKCEPSIIKGLKIKSNQQKVQFKKKGLKIKPKIKQSFGYQLDLVDAANEIVQVRKAYRKIAKIEHHCKYFNFKQRDALRKWQRECKNIGFGKQSFNRRKAKIKGQLMNLLGRYPELLHDRTEGFSAKSEPWEGQPWISRVAKMVPGASKINKFLRNSQATMEDNVIKTIHSLCMTPKMVPKADYVIGTLNYKNTSTPWPKEYRDCYSKLRAKGNKERKRIELLYRLVEEEKISGDETLRTRIKRICKDETAYNLHQLIGFKSARDSVLRDFKNQEYLRLDQINSCVKTEKETEEFYRQWMALGVGVSCLVGSGLLAWTGFGAAFIGVTGTVCTGVDIAIAVNNYYHYEDNWLKTSRCTQAQHCNMDSYEQAVASYNNALNEIYYAVGGAVITDLIIPGAVNLRDQFRKIKELGKAIEEGIKHLPQHASHRFNHAMERINKLNGKAKLKEMIKLKEDLDEFNRISAQLTKRGRSISSEMRNCFIK